MSKIKKSSEKKKNEVLGSVASMQTLLERYPTLITVNPETGDSSLSFMLDLLKILGVTDDEIIEWLSNILSNANGLINTVETSIKGVLIAWFKNMYTCSVNPILPTDIMATVYGSAMRRYGDGIKISINDIDYFGILNNCPTSKEGSIFYFDNSDNKYTPLNICYSTDMNAYLWYVINRGSLKGDENRRRKNVWDNRVSHLKKLEDATMKANFVDTKCENRATAYVNNVGYKKEIIISEFVESGTTGEFLRIFLPSDRYYSATLKKTIFEFNFDYISSLKLFDSKTLSAQIINAILGIASGININMSLERYEIEEEIREIVKNIMNQSDEETEDCYFSFSNDEYDEMQKRGLQKYKNVQITESEVKEEIVQQISTIGDNPSQTDICNVFKSISKIVKNSDITDDYNVTINGNIIKTFIEETAVELCLQILSPKVLLLFAINEKIMNPTGENSFDIKDFLNNFKNMIISIVKSINSIILKLLNDYLLQQLKPILVLFTEKLLLETITYYRTLLSALYESCGANFGMTNFSLFGTDALNIDNVYGADIVPTENKPKTNC